MCTYVPNPPSIFNCSKTLDVLFGSSIAQCSSFPKYSFNLFLLEKDWKLMSTSTFCCGKLYISEARNKLALESIERAAKQFPDAPIVNEFKDETYNRVGYTLVSLSSDSLKNAVFSMATAAYEVIDLDLHTGSHPRLGVVDHICFHPLAATSLEQVATIAKAIAKEVGSMLKGLLHYFLTYF
ncbi:putative formimidoyltetrahydrofolate cyclodeaminase, Glutamate formimidoyltransferase [Helianthus annuus]|nr:putative formimidoyltetrahydrofolate cyclodeaminase, Glutamate formimidoyltransferase [Helianthus annuus]KAJ0634550.1 putative formimidoyltetrahydrofolate cyclodeaminase, Glutamate formimidoyltransferase [Helianthus annuus]